jgi:preprotein translocase subunit SecD
MMAMAGKVDWAGLLRNRRVQLVLASVAVALALIAFRGMNTGIEFSGGVRIPLTLAREVDPAAMDSIVETLKLRINKFGLSQSVVRPVGRNSILVEVPRASNDVIESVRKILHEQGNFEVFIDGQPALTGSDIMPGAVGGSNQERIIDTTDGKSWELGFAVSREGGERFAKAALGKGNYPVYMFLDRPSSAVIIAKKTTVLPNATALFGSTPQNAIGDALRKAGDDIALIYAEDFSNSTALPQSATQAIIEEGADKQHPQVLNVLSRVPNMTIKYLPSDQFTPEYTPVSSFGAPNSLSVSRWAAIGLKSAPILSPSLADGRVSQLFQVTGPAKGATAEEQAKNAQTELKELKSVISGGRLPVSITIGSSFVMAPSLGEKFLWYSWQALAVSIFSVSLLMFLRYRRAALVAPIVAFNSFEVILTTALVGVFGTLDLSAMAGIIVLMGSGVADQIVITEEMLRRGAEEKEEEAVARDQYEIKERIAKAFYIVFTVAGVVVGAMLPLILSGIVEIVGFGISTILGVLVGVFITRPAYGDVMREMFEKKSSG